jgi:hypothetical protein
VHITEDDAGFLVRPEIARRQIDQETIPANWRGCRRHNATCNWTAETDHSSSRTYATAKTI